jgi:hypothetical protein
MAGPGGLTANGRPGAATATAATARQAETTRSSMKVRFGIKFTALGSETDFL